MCILSSCLRLCLLRVGFLDIWTSIRLASSCRWFFQTQRHWNLDESLVGEARFLDHRHSTSSLLPPFECLPFLHARMDRRRLNALQFTSDKNPVAGLYVSSLEFVARGLSVSGGV